MEEAKDYTPGLEGFISDECSICREERQYALFLYNYICWIKKNQDSYKLKEKLFGDSEIEIEYVFYEATFMRDFFERDRRLAYLNGAKGTVEQKQRSKILQKNAPRATKPNVGESRFNVQLLKFMQLVAKNNLNNKDEKQNTVVEKSGRVKFHFQKWNYVTDKDLISNAKVQKRDKYERLIDCHLGSIAGQTLLKEILLEDKDGKDKIRILARALMNSKPDIAVVYKKKGDKNRYLQFLECKFESDEGENGKDVKNNIFQTEAQDLIAYFLTKFSPGDLNDAGDNHYRIADEFEHSKLVQFYREESMIEKEEGVIYIHISDLIEHHKKMFD